MNESYYEGLLQSMLNHLTTHAQVSKQANTQIIEQAMDAVKRTQNGETVQEALATINIADEQIRKHVRAFLYVVAIGGIIAATETQQGITHKQAEDYINYLKEVGDFTD